MGEIEQVIKKEDSSDAKHWCNGQEKRRVWYGALVNSAASDRRWFYSNILTKPAGHSLCSSILNLFLSLQLCLAVIAAHYVCCDEARGEGVPGGAG